MRGIRSLPAEELSNYAQEEELRVAQTVFKRDITSASIHVVRMMKCVRFTGRKRVFKRQDDGTLDPNLATVPYGYY